MGEFSGDPEEIVSTLDEFLDVKTPWAQPTETFDLGSVFHEMCVFLLLLLSHRGWGFVRFAGLGLCPPPPIWRRT